MTEKALVAHDMDVPQNARWDVASTANGDHELRLEVIQDALRRVLAQLVHLVAQKTVSHSSHARRYRKATRARINGKEAMRKKTSQGCG